MCIACRTSSNWHLISNVSRFSKYEYKGKRWRRISKQGKAFIDDLLVVDPEDRATCEEAMRASWLGRRFGATVRNPYREELNAARESMIKFSDHSKLRKVALMVVAHKSTSAEIGILRKVFQQYDKRGAGQLTYEEFEAAMKEAGYEGDDYEKIFEAMVCVSLSGQIPY
jgi:calcium-dependent protein kinase